MKILICLMFRNSAMWIDKFTDCIVSLLREGKNDNITYSLSILYGNSNDGTNEKLEIFKDLLSTRYKDVEVTLTRIDLPDRFDVIQRLAILRNTFLNIHDTTLKQYDYLMHIDTDITFRPHIVKRLIKNIENPIKGTENIGIVAPLIFVENVNDINGFFYDTFAFRLNKKLFLHKKPYVPVQLKKNKGKWLIEVDSVGTMYLMKTDIFYKYKITYGTHIRDNTNEHPKRKYESEQVVFCNSVTQNTPYKVYVNLSLAVHHVNLEQYGLAWH